MSPDYLIEPFGRHHDRTAFSCGEPALDRYLKQQASQDVARSLAAVFVLSDPQTNRVAGYYTLSALSAQLTDFPSDIARRLPNYQLPTTLIGRLAIDSSIQHQGFGKDLLIDALWRAFTQRVQIGSIAVIVDAKHDAARAFYERQGFRRFTGNEYRLFIMMKTIRSLLPPEAR